MQSFHQHEDASLAFWALFFLFFPSIHEIVCLFLFRHTLSFDLVDELEAIDQSISQALDEEMSDQDVNDMIAEIDEDASGTVDYEEFKAVMTGGNDE